MSEPKTGPALRVRTVAEPPFSGEAVAELIRAVLDRGKAFRFRALGLSMSPFIKDGDVITVAPLGSVPPRTGEIATFVHSVSGKVRVHRIVGVERGRYLLKGDNALESDGEVSAEHILGRVIRVERSGRRVWPGRGLAGAAIARALRSGWLVRVLRRAARTFRRERKGT